MDHLLLLGADNPLGHVVDKTLIATPGGTALVTMHSVTMTVAALLGVYVLWVAANRIQTGPESQGSERYITKGAIAQGVEAICVYLRNGVVRPLLGEETDRYIKYLWAVFFFILFNNLLGLVPLLDLQHLIGGLAWGDSHFAKIGGTATGNIAVTAALAVIAFFVVQVHGIRSNGLGGYLKHFLGGAPLFLAPVMLPVEILGTFIKPFALAIRLFANMFAGHTLLATMLMFTKMATEGVGWLGGGAISVVAILSATALMFLELFVAFLQAFVFMFLVTVFLSQLSHHGHDHDHEHDHAHDHGPSASPALAGAH